MSTLVTFEKVSAAAQQLQSSGQRPSVRLVIATLGGGSPNAVLPFLNQWKTSEPSIQKPQLSLEPAIAKVIAQQVAVMTAQATASAEARITDLSMDSELLARAGREAEEKNQQFETELAQARGEIAQLTGQLTERSREIESVRLDGAKQMAVLQASIEHERQLALGIRDDLLRAQFKLEALPALQANVAELTRQLRDAEHSVSMARQDAAVAEAKFEAQLARAQEAQERKDHAREQLTHP